MSPELSAARRQLGGVINRSLHRRILLLSVIFSFLLSSCAAKLAAKTEPIADNGGREVTSLAVASAANIRLGDIPSFASHTTPGSIDLNSWKETPGKTGSCLISSLGHPRVQKYIRFYQVEGRDTFAYALKRSWLHLPVMKDILTSYGVPSDLVYVTLVESCFDTVAVSPRGAAGIWQIMPGTARQLGLRVSRRHDERFDLVKSTQAAAKYLRILHDELNSWPLAVAAYNAGVPLVDKALRRHRKNTVWELTKIGALPRETSAFVSKVFAMIVIANDLDGHGFERPRHAPGEAFDFVWVENDLKLHQVAQWVGSSVRELRTLNPSLTEDLIVSGGEGFCLRVPFQTRERFKLAYEQFRGLDG
jgi:membrane-bound lytic murein transglycosylase D